MNTVNPSVVFDCNVFLQALANDESAAAKALDFLEAGLIKRDPKDEMYINLAIVANASHLVSRDKDLLDLMTASTEVARHFRSRYPFLRIMKAADFVKEMESGKIGS